MRETDAEASAKAADNWFWKQLWLIYTEFLWIHLHNFDIIGVNVFTASQWRDWEYIITAFIFLYIRTLEHTRDAAGGTSTETVGRKQGCAVKINFDYDFNWSRDDVVEKHHIVLCSHTSVCFYFIFNYIFLLLPSRGGSSVVTRVCTVQQRNKSL